MSETENPYVSPATSGKPVARRYLFWPIFLTSLISIHIVSVVVMVIVATHDNSFAIEPDWYQKGLHYEQTAQQQRANSRLGWSVQVERRPATDRHEPAQRDLHRSRPWRQAHGKCRRRSGGLRPSPCQQPQVECSAAARGRTVRGDLAFEDPGMWEFRLVITPRQGDVYAYRETRNLTANSPRTLGEGQGVTATLELCNHGTSRRRLDRQFRRQPALRRHVRAAGGVCRRRSDGGKAGVAGLAACGLSRRPAVDLRPGRRGLRHTGRGGRSWRGPARLPSVPRPCWPAE